MILYNYSHIYHYLFIYLFNRIDLLAGEKQKSYIKMFDILFFLSFFFTCPYFYFYLLLLQPRMPSVNYSARGVHAAHQKKKKRKTSTVFMSIVNLHI